MFLLNMNKQTMTFINHPIDHVPKMRLTICILCTVAIHFGYKIGLLLKMIEEIMCHFQILSHLVDGRYMFCSQNQSDEANIIYK